MQENNMIDLLGSLKEMSSEQLSRLIQAETAKEYPNDELVLMALDILDDRERDSPIELGPKGKDAWKKFQSKVRSRNRKTVLIWKPLMQVASVLLVITLLFALLPTQVNAETWWERLARWTDDFFSFFNPNAAEAPADEYVFQTDNEGLQQVYDAVVELGAKESIVPMWLPEGYKIVEVKTHEIPGQKLVTALFADGDKEVVFRYCFLMGEIQSQYYKDDSEVNSYEKDGTNYRIVQNEEISTVIWMKDNIECSFSIDCQESYLYNIIESIYRWRFDE